MVLDIRTLSLTSSIISIALAAVMMHIHTTHKTYHGFNYWVVAAISMILGLFLMSMRGFIPDLFTIVLANLLMLAHYALVMHGLIIFLNRQSKIWVYVIMTLLYLVMILFFTYVSPNISVRIVVVTILSMIFYPISLIHIQKYSKDIRIDPNFLLIVTFIILILYSLFRIIYTLFYEDHISDFMVASAIQGIMFLVIIFTNITMFIGLIMLNQQAIERDYLEGEAEIQSLRGVIPICMHCKEIRDDDGYWQQLEQYISDHADVQFSHGICDKCLEKYYSGIYPTISDEDE